jgi:hypothetical protein
MRQDKTRQDKTREEKRREAKRSEAKRSEAKRREEKRREETNRPTTIPPPKTASDFLLVLTGCIFSCVGLPQKSVGAGPVGIWAEKIS